MSTGGAAGDALGKLAVKGRAPKTGYDRALFGQAWSDDVSVQGGRNGCDTRNDVLRRDLRQVELKPGSSGCTVLSGVLRDPYTDGLIDFRRGTATSSLVQVDHVVALGNSWATGAQQLSSERRQDFANDPLNLWAVAGRVNQQKGAGDAATWLPPNTAIRCEYVARQIAVKVLYELWVTAPERNAMLRVLDRCPGQPLPSAPGWHTPAIDKPAIPPRTTAPGPPTTMPEPHPTATSSAVVYENCGAVRAAGAAPIHRGEPGYSTKLDRDRDGIACEV